MSVLGNLFCQLHNRARIRPECRLRVVAFACGGLMWLPVAMRTAGWACLTQRREGQCLEPCPGDKCGSSRMFIVRLELPRQLHFYRVVMSVRGGVMTWFLY